MAKTTSGLDATTTIFKKQVRIVGSSENIGRFEFNNGTPVTFEKKDVIEGFKAYDIDLEKDYSRIFRSLPDQVGLDRLLIDYNSGEFELAVKLDFDNDFIANKYSEIIKLDSVSFFIQRLPDVEVTEQEDVEENNSEAN